MRTRRRIAEALFLALVTLAATTTAAIAQETGASSLVEKDENLGGGFDATKVYDFSGLDSVNTFNGNLSIGIPVGPDYPVDGDLAFSIGLAYNSSLWRFKSFVPDSVIFQEGEGGGGGDLCDGVGSYTQAWPSWLFNAGLGWEVSLGRIYEPTPEPADATQEEQELDGVTVNADQPWVYLGPDGGRHELFEGLHGTQISGGDLPLFSRDGSSLRLRCDAGQTDLDLCGRLVLEFSDGSRRELLRDPDEPDGNGWRPVLIADPFGNELTVSYGPNTWTVSDAPVRGDAEAREWTVTFEPPPTGTFGRKRVRTIEIPGAEGTTLVYEMDYGTPTPIQRPCRDTYPWGRTLARPDDALKDRTITVSLLRGIRVYGVSASGVPGETLQTFDFDYHGEDGQLQCVNGPGQLARMTLPTGGSTEYDYTGYEFPTAQECPAPGDPVGECNYLHQPANLSTGVRERRIYDWEGSPLGTWRYRPSLELVDSSDEVELPLCGELRQTRTTVIDPLGHRTEQFYSVYVQGNDLGEGWTREEYGMPFTRAESLGAVGEGPFLSSRRWSCPQGSHDSTLATADLCELVSERYARYDYTPEPLCDTTGEIPSTCGQNHSRRTVDRVVYQDPDQAPGIPDTHFVETRSSCFDGLGNFRIVEKNSNLPGSQLRETAVHYNPSSGSLGACSDPGLSGPFSPPGRWLLDTYDRVEVSENGLTERADFAFDPDTGFLERSRAFLLTEGTPAPRARDVVTERVPDGAGNVIRLDRHGGAGDPVPTSGALGSLDLGVPEYRVTRTWRHGVLETQQWIDPDDQTETLSTIDHRSIDPNTGLVLATADPSGVQTSFSYDALGRLLERTPAADLATVYDHGLLERPPRIGVGRGGIPSAETESRYVFDGLGRVRFEHQRLPGNAWSEVETRYLPGGATESVSDRHAASVGLSGVPSTGAPARGRTLYSGYDALGRPSRIVAPDGRPTDFEYFGIRKKRTVFRQVARTLGSPANTTDRTEIYDLEGRLTELFEPSETLPDGNLRQTKTTYTYDAGGRLATVSAGGQTRRFDYDGRGFLGGEGHPEMETVDAAGRISIQYLDHDSLGKPGRIRNADAERLLDYDFAGRLVRVSEAPYGRALEEYFYGRENRGASRERGKLVATRRTNYLSGPRVAVSERFEYAAPQGRLSRRSVRAYDLDDQVEGVRYVQTFEYDLLGQLQETGYPACRGGLDGQGFPKILDACSPAGGDRTIRYDHDRGYLSSVSELLDGAVRPLIDRIEYDPNGMVRRVVHASDASGSEVEDRITPDPSGMARPRSIAFTGPVAGRSLGTHLYDGLGNPYSIGGDDFRYDGVGRLVEGEVLGGAKRQEASYDVHGNLTRLWTSDFPAGDDGTIPVDSATNRLNGPDAVYSGAGRVLAVRGLLPLWTAQGQMRSLEGQGVNRELAYDVNGERILILDHMAGETVWTVRGPDGRLLRRHSGSGGVSDYVYRGSQLAARFADGSPEHYHLDHLGTPRLVTDASGQEVSRHDYYPFGEEAFAGGVDHPTRRRDDVLRFTGHERDLNGESRSDPAVDDLDYMHARYYMPRLGRFLTVDPENGGPENPQSWNRYAYVMGNPLNLTDPTGRCPVILSGVPGACAVIPPAPNETLPVTYSSFTLEFATPFGIFTPFLGGTVTFGAVRDVEGDFGLYVSPGRASGWSLGATAGTGVALRGEGTIYDLEGPARGANIPSPVGLDIPFGATLGKSETGVLSASLTAGPEVGVSGYFTDTEVFSVRDAGIAAAEQAAEVATRPFRRLLEEASDRLHKFRRRIDRWLGEPE